MRLMVVLPTFTMCNPGSKDYPFVGIYRTYKRGESLKEYKKERNSGINTSLRAVGIMDNENLRKRVGW